MKQKFSILFHSANRILIFQLIDFQYGTTLKYILAPSPWSIFFSPFYPIYIPPLRIFVCLATFILICPTISIPSSPL